MTAAGRGLRLLLLLGVWVAASACGDDAAPPSFDAGMDAARPTVDAGPAPTCGASRCGSPLVGSHCCTSARDVTAGVAGVTARCGADLGELIPELAGACVELRRAGDLDNACPSQWRGSARGGTLEPGCCTRQGVCGTFNAAADLGCQTALSSSLVPAACSGSTTVDAGTLDAGTLDAN